MAALCRVGELSITTFTCTALRAMQTRSIDEKAVRLSVRLSNACIETKGKNDLSRFLYHTKDHLA